MSTATVLHHRVTVRATPERAFEVFVGRFGDWWPKQYKLFDDDLAERTLEPREGGRITDRGDAGSTCSWGRVLAFEPPSRLVFSWDISPRWEPEPDPARCSEVEVRFTPEGDDATLVTVEHRHLDRHGEDWPSLAGALDGDGGWPGVLRAYDALAGDRVG